MEELFAYAILLYENIVTEEMYQKKLNELFLKNSENEMLLKLEWETDIDEAILYIRTHIEYQNINYEKFGKSIIRILKKYYEYCTDIKQFAEKSSPSGLLFLCPKDRRNDIEQTRHSGKALCG